MTPDQHIPHCTKFCPVRKIQARQERRRSICVAMWFKPKSPEPVLSMVVLAQVQQIAPPYPNLDPTPDTWAWNLHISCSLFAHCTRPACVGVDPAPTPLRTLVDGSRRTADIDAKLSLPYLASIWRIPSIFRKKRTLFDNSVLWHHISPFWIDNGIYSRVSSTNIFEVQHKTKIVRRCKTESSTN